MFEFLKKKKGIKTFDEAICIRTGVYENHTFKKGEIYPVCGWNNGKQLVYQDKDGDARIIWLADTCSDEGFTLAPFDETINTPRFQYMSEYKGA